MKFFSRKIFFPVFGFWILIFDAANALPRKGFHEGPFLALAAGITQFDWDVNQRTGVQEGNSYEPAFGLLFGWNVRDGWAPELQLRYATESEAGRREHIAAVNTGIVFTLLLDALTDLGHWQILPFLRPGGVYQLATIPGDPLSSSPRLISQGGGPSIGGGIRVLFKKYLYVGLQAQEEFIWHNSHTQSLPGLGNVLVYKGGMDLQFQAFLTLGVHF